MLQSQELSYPDLDKLLPVFQRYPKILAVYLFGSAASGKTNRLSDLDLAVVPRDNTLQKQRLDMLADLARAGFCNIDLVFLDTDDIVLKFEAVRHNKLLYQSQQFDSGSYFSKVVRQYFDFQPYLAVQRLAYKRRILSG